MSEGRSTQPIYRQLVEHVRRQVATVNLPAADAPPSLHLLTVNLNVHLNNVALAYPVLARQGIVRLR